MLIIKKNLLSVKRFMRTRLFAIAVLSCVTAVVAVMLYSKVNAVEIIDNGVPKIVFTTKTSQSEIIREQRITLKPGDKVEFEPPENKFASLVIARSFPVSIVADNKEINLRTLGGTVSSALAEANITLNEFDEVNYPLDTFLTENMNIIVDRVEYKTYTQVSAIPFTKEQKATPLLRKSVYVLEQGKQGKTQTTYKDKYVNGVKVETAVLKVEKIANPVPQVELVPAPSKTMPVSSLNPDIEKNPDGSPKHYKKIISGSATAYSAREGAYTASGRKAIVGHVAVDPRVIPYGSLLYVVSKDRSFVYGYCIAADTGTALWQGSCVVDLFFGSYRESCLFGRKNVDIYVVK